MISLVVSPSRTSRRLLLRWTTTLLVLVATVSVAMAQNGAMTLMWQVRAGEKPATVHLLGSLHMADGSLYPVDPAINRAFLESEALALEIDVSPEKIAAAEDLVQRHTRLPKGETLQQHLTPQGFETLRAFLVRQRLPLSRLMDLRPLTLMAALVNQKMESLGYETRHGVDEYFLRRARAAGMPVLELETLEGQLRMDETLPPLVQEKVLLRSLDELKDVEAYARELMQAWRQGDDATIERLTFEDRRSHPDLDPFYAMLFDARNEQMARKIKEFADSSRRVFVVVGAGHLVGERSVRHFLEIQGLTSVQVPALSGGPKERRAARLSPPRDALPVATHAAVR